MYTYSGIKIILVTLILLLGSLAGYLGIKYKDTPKTLIVKTEIVDDVPVIPTDSIEVFMGTFLGNETRNYYGDSIPLSLDVIWKFEIGGGETNPTGREVEEWHGAGWTGQPLIVVENKHPYIIQGCYDHTLKKMDAITGEMIWEYRYDDVLKGTGTIWENPNATDPLNRFLILQGARLGLNNSLRQDTIPSYRAISYLSGKEVWRLNVKSGPSFSRDVDGSALILNDTAYIGLENGYFSIFTPGPYNLVSNGTYNYKQMLGELPMFANNDRAKHGGELVIESSPSRIGNHIYVTAGSGHVYGYHITERKIDWDFYVGCDMNGSPVVTADSCIIVTLEKEFIAGHGGAMKLDPSKAPENAVVWYFPTGDKEFSNWEGGIVGSVAVNDYYKTAYEKSMACVSALDGNLYLIAHQEINDSLKVLGPDNTTLYPTPIVLSMSTIGSTISTPIFVNHRICAAGYSGIHIFEIAKNYQLNKVASFSGIFEATPTAYKGNIYIASKNGFLYCLGQGTKVESANQDSLQ